MLFRLLGLHRVELRCRLTGTRCGDRTVSASLPAQPAAVVRAVSGMSDTQYHSPSTLSFYGVIPVLAPFQGQVLEIADSRPLVYSKLLAGSKQAAVNSRLVCNSQHHSTSPE